MALSWVGGSPFVETSGTSLAASAPSGIADGDLLIAAVFARSAITAPSGWTQQAITSNFGYLNQRLAVYTKDSVTSSDAAASFSWAQASSERMGVVYAVVRDHGAIEQIATATGTGVDFTATPPSVTATANDELAVCFMSMMVGDFGQSPTGPTSFTLFSGQPFDQYRLAGSYRSGILAGQSTAGAVNMHPGFVDDPEFPISPFDNPYGAAVVRISGASETAVEGLTESPGPLGAAAVLGAPVIAAQAGAASPLGSAAAAAWHDFTGQIGDSVTRYVVDLTDSEDATVRVPISSWQATLQTGAKNYVQCVIPACAPYVDAITDAVSLSIKRIASLPGGAEIEYEMANAPTPTATLAQGARNYTATMSGYSTAFAEDDDPPAVYDRQLQSIRTITTTPTSVRVRCGIDWLLRPGHRALVTAEQELNVAFINYYCNATDEYMDVGNRAA